MWMNVFVFFSFGARDASRNTDSIKHRQVGWDETASRVKKWLFKVREWLLKVSRERRSKWLPKGAEECRVRWVGEHTTRLLKRPLGPSVSCRLERLAVRVSHLMRTLKGHMGGMASSKCLKTRQDVFANFQWVHFARLIIQPNVLEQVWMQNTKQSSNVTSTVVRTERQPASVHTEGQSGPDSAPPRPCPSGWAAWCWRWRCCRPNRAGCRSCSPATSWGSGRESPASRGRLSSWPGWAEAGGRTPASWVSPAGWWGGNAPGRGWAERGLYADEGPGRGWRGRGGEGCPGCLVHLKRKGMQKKKNTFHFNSISFYL